MPYVTQSQQKNSSYTYLIVYIMFLLILSACTGGYVRGIDLNLTPQLSSTLSNVRVVSVYGLGSGDIGLLIKEELKTAGFTIVESPNVQHDLSIQFDLKFTNGNTVKYIGGGSSYLIERGVTGTITAFDRNHDLLCQDTIEESAYAPEKIMWTGTAQDYIDKIALFYFDRKFIRGNVVALVDILINKGIPDDQLKKINMLVRDMWRTAYLIDKGITKENMSDYLEEDAKALGDIASTDPDTRVRMLANQRLAEASKNINSNKLMRSIATIHLKDSKALEEIAQSNDIAGRVASIRLGVVDPVVARYMSQEPIISVTSRSIYTNIVGLTIREYLTLEVRVADKIIASGTEERFFSTLVPANSTFIFTPEDVLFTMLSNLSISGADMNEIIRTTSSPHLKQAAIKTIENKKEQQ